MQGRQTTSQRTFLFRPFLCECASRSAQLRGSRTASWAPASVRIANPCGESTHSKIIRVPAELSSLKQCSEDLDSARSLSLLVCCAEILSKGASRRPQFAEDRNTAAFYLPEFVQGRIGKPHRTRGPGKSSRVDERSPSVLSAVRLKSPLRSATGLLPFQGLLH